MTEQDHRSERREHLCVFCGIVRGELEASKIRESDSTMSLMSLEGNPIVIPKKHIISPIEDTELAAEVFAEAARLSIYVKEVFDTEDFNILANIGRKSGQEVPHFHVHILPRVPNDNLIRITYVQPRERENLDALAEAFRASIAVTDGSLQAQ